MLVWQTTQLIEWYQLTEHGEWSYAALIEAEDTVDILELGVALTVGEVYAETGIGPIRAATCVTDV